MKQIDLNDCRKVGAGARRPEDVAIARNGDVWLSHQGKACARIDGQGNLQPLGQAGGAPNGINFDLQGASSLPISVGRTTARDRCSVLIRKRARLKLSAGRSVAARFMVATIR